MFHRPSTPTRTLLLAAVSLCVAIASIGWIVAGGGRPIDPALSDRIDERLIAAQGEWGGYVFHSVLDSLVLVIKNGLTYLFAFVQVVSCLLLAGMAVVAWRGDEAGLWAMRSWAWCTLVVETLAQSCTGWADVGSWVRLAYAVFVLWTIRRPMDPARVGLRAPEAGRG